MQGPEIRLAYLFWLPWVFGFAGLHRFYLGKPVSGLVYLVTWGLFGLGTLYDAVTMPQLVRRARVDRRLDDILASDRLDDRRRENAPGRPAPPPLEQAILRLAAERHGVVTPSRVAIAAEVAPETARGKLDELCAQGFAEVRVTREGVIVYAFPEFLDDTGRADLEEIT